MSSTNYAISIIVILILGLIVKEAAIQDSIKIILCTIVGLVAYSALNTSYSTEKFAVAPKRLTRDDINSMIDLKISAFSSATTSSDRGMTFDQVNTLIRDKMGTISASPSASASSSSLTSTQLDNLTKLTVLSDLKASELNTLAKLAETPPVGLTSAQTTTLTTLGALSGLTAAQTASLTALSGLTTAQTASLSALSGLTAAQITTLMGLVAPPVTVAGVATTSVKLPDNMPPGTIVIWSGSLDDIPSDWILCDGTNKTPKLQGRFILGAYPENAKEADIENTRLKKKYGSDDGTSTLYLNKENLPPHKHKVTVNLPEGMPVGYSSVNEYYPARDTKTATEHTTTDNIDCGKGGLDINNIYYDDFSKNTDKPKIKEVGNPVNIMPPYFVLAYIMKKFP